MLIRKDLQNSIEVVALIQRNVSSLNEVKLSKNERQMGDQPSRTRFLSSREKKGDFISTNVLHLEHIDSSMTLSACVTTLPIGEELTNRRRILMHIFLALEMFG